MFRSRSRTQGAVFALGLMVVLGGCGGGGSGSSVAAPANVAGRWDGSGLTNPANSEKARFSRCTGAFAAGQPTQLEGLLAKDTLASCTFGPGPGSGPIPVTQAGSTFTITPTPFACSNSLQSAWTGTLSGGGTVDGSALEGETTMVQDGGGLTQKQWFTGTVDGDQVTVLINRFEDVDEAGTLNGACDIEPPLEYRVTISR